MSSNNVRAAKAMSDEIERLLAIDNPTAEETETMEGLIAAAPAVARAAKIERLRQYAGQPGHVEKEAEPAASFSIVRNAGADPWSHLRDGGTAPVEARSAALAAIERVDLRDVDAADGDTRNRLTQLVDEAEDDHLARYLVAASAPAYRSAFKKLLKDPVHGVGLLNEEERQAFAATQTREMRTAMSTTGANGGYLIPFHLDPSIILTNDGSKNPLRQISRVETITSDVWHGVSSAGVTGEWLAEASEFTDASPTFLQPTINVEKAGAYVQASWEAAADTNIDAQLAMVFSDAKDRLEATAFVTGSGSGQPVGILTALQANTASTLIAAQTNGSFGAIDIYTVDNGLPSRYRANASWLAHWSIYNLVRQFPGADSSSSFWVDLGPGRPSSLLGHSTYESSVMMDAPLSTATASSDDVLILGDFKNFVIVDRIGMTIATVPVVLGTNRRPTGEIGWACYWRVGADSVDDSGFRMLRV